jgi:glycogen operon protein
MHVDGFRFDLASVLGRDQDGALLADPPLIERIAEDPVLGEVKMIAEAWDAAGAYQVGSFFKRRWAEWNGHFRDDVRRFWRGDAGMAADFAHRLCGSDDLYEAVGKAPDSSINYVTCHDGFTLNDLVSYARKHNEANGEMNREGDTSDPSIQAVRHRQVKNFLLTLFVSRGVPMLLAGDEHRRTQGGNNNAYCQDNETSWVDWGRRDRYADIEAFVRALIAFRRSHPVLTRMAYYGPEEVVWFRPDGAEPAWNDAAAPNRLGCMIRDGDRPVLLLLFNAHPEATTFVLPAEVAQHSWWLRVDTARSDPEPMIPLEESELAGGEGGIPVEGYACLLAEVGAT